MRLTIKKLLSFAGKENFEIDKRIGITYILRLCLKYGLQLLRGEIRRLGYRNIGNKLFLGVHVRLIQKSMIKIGKNVRIDDYCKLNALSVNGISIGDNVVIGRNTVIECTGDLQHIGLGVAIGDRTTFGGDCFFGAAGGIKIGSDVAAGQNIRFHSENHCYDDLSILIKEQGTTRIGIKIGDNCWIGSGAVFLDGSIICDGTVVAANAIVAGTFPPDSVVGGVPAKIIKFRGKKEIQNKLKDASTNITV